MGFHVSWGRPGIFHGNIGAPRMVPYFRGGGWHGGLGPLDSHDQWKKVGV